MKSIRASHIVSVLILLTPLFSFGISWNPLVWFRPNFHTVQKGQCYRAKTLSKDALESYIKKYNIKTILNVRESDPKADWYINEIALSKKYGISFHTVTLDAAKMPTGDQVKRILDVFDSAQGPLLIHCKLGADRTGLASALWKTEKMGASLKEALDQQRVKYGHVAWRFPQMRKFTQKWHELKVTYKGNTIKMLKALP